MHKNVHFRCLSQRCRFLGNGTEVAHARGMKSTCASLLVVDDDPGLAHSLTMILTTAHEAALKAAPSLHIKTAAYPAKPLDSNHRDRGQGQAG